MEIVSGGVCSPKGFSAGGVHCGIRKNRTKRDLALIFSKTVCSAASVYTLNKVKGAPIEVTRQHLQNGVAQAILCNSGNANTCNSNGFEIAEGMCELLAKELKIPADNVIVASTGVIGQPISLEPIRSGMKSLVESLGDYSKDAAEAIMTTDTALKERAISFTISEKQCKIGGIAKGSGMIHPNMATMLVFITSDVAITPEMLQKALLQDTNESFNMISVDGDTSTNDMVSILANGEAKNTLITSDGKDFEIFCKALREITTYLCRAIAKDGEGATKLLECKTYNAKTKEAAKISAKSVISSSLFKAAMFGADANWGRVLCAIGYSGADVDVQKIDVTFSSKAGSLIVCKAGFGIAFDESFAKTVLKENEITIEINLNDGAETATAWGCDLTYDYVKINGDYRT